MATFLIVDDAKTAQILLRAVITDIGHEVIGIAEDGVAALEKYESLEPDIVLMDITMPHMDGIEASRTILEKHPAAKIIIISGHDDPNFIEQIVDGGQVIQFLLKPLTREKLEAVLAEVL